MCPLLESVSLLKLGRCTHGASVGVSGLDGGSGMPIKVGVAMLCVVVVLKAVRRNSFMEMLVGRA